MPKTSELGLNFEHWCFACGKANPSGLHLDFDVAPDRAETRFTPRREHEGYGGIVHGGVVTALLDETMGWAIFHQGMWGVTARLRVTFRKPVTVGEEVRVVGEVARDRGRGVDLRGEIRRAADDELLVTAEATYLKMPEEKRRELMKIYGDPTSALARLRAEGGTG